MAENKQNNSEIKNTTTENDNKTPTGGGATSTKQARDANTETDKTTNPTSSAVGKNAVPTGSAPTGNVTDAAKDTLNTVKESAGAVAGEAMGQVKDKAGSVLGEQKANLASGITSVADSIRQVGENLGGSGENNQIAALAGKYGDSLAGQIEKFSSYIEEREIRELMRDVEQFARRNPALFVGGAFTLGILAARFLKSSGGQNQASRRRSRNDS